MTKEMVISASRHETKVAILEDDQLVEIYFQRAKEYSLAGSIHKGRVTRVLPGMQSAFVDLGLERDAFLYVSDFLEESGEDYERVSVQQEERGHRHAARPAPHAGNGRDSAEADTQQDRRGRRSRRRRGRGGRGFPESKYAERSPGYAAPAAEPAPETETGSQEEPLVLPGESLAKYRGAPPAAQESFEDRAGVPEGTVETSELAESLDAGIDAADLLADRLIEEDRLNRDEEEDEEIESGAPAGAGLEADQALGEETEDSEALAEEEAVAEFELEPAAGADTAEAIGEAEAAPGAEDAGGPFGESAGEPQPAGSEERSASVREEIVPRYISRHPNRRFRRRVRGDRGDRGESARPEPRHEQRAAAAPESAPLPSIADLLKENQEILVQIAKEPLGQKGARITSHIALPGRYVVYMPTLDHLGVSRKISTDEERLRLKRIVQTHSQGMSGGFIVRTAGEGRSEEELSADMNFLYNLWMDIRQKAERRKAPCLLYHDLEIVRRTLRDQLSEQFKAIWVDDEETYEGILHFLERFMPSMVSRVKLYTRTTPIFEAFSITSELEKALRPKVWLKSGGYIVINQTEALVAIDINTGKYVGKSNRLEDTIVRTNTEAIKEIVRQIRLRDLGGIIVVDFIDMDERKNRQKVMLALEDAMRSDRAPYKVLQFNDFGLVAITRRRVKQSLERALCAPCSVCDGSGFVKSPQTVIGEILTEATKMAKAVEGKEVLLRAHPDVAKALKSGTERYLEELEEILGRPILVKSDALLHPEKFDLG